MILAAVWIVVQLDHFRHWWAVIWNPDAWGPNVPPTLIALALVLVLVWIRVLLKDEHSGKSWRQVLHDELRATTHEIEGAEEEIASEVVDQIKDDAKC